MITQILGAVGAMLLMGTGLGLLLMGIDIMCRVLAK